MVGISVPSFDQPDWDDLLDLIEEGQVVPVVGPALLTSDDGSNDTYTQRLALRVAAYLKVLDDNLPPGRELYEVASRYLAGGGQPDRLYRSVNRVASEVEPDHPPRPLFELAEITNLRLFLTTTFDSLLARALNEVRQAPPDVKTYRLDRWEDMPADDSGSSSCLVYHLFGKLTAVPNEFAITEEDTLEFMHALQSESRRPAVLFGELDRRCLLILGCSFPSWLARFFLRIPWKERLSSPSRRTHFLADSNLGSDADQILFLRQFSKATHIYPSSGPIEFVSELNKRWKERSSRQPVRSQPSAALPRANKAEVFLSYASEDLEIVKAIWKKLDASGVPAFLDRYGLGEGEEYEAKFARGIRECALFLAIVSRNTLTEGRRFFRKEWRMALEEAHEKSFDPESVFVVPVIIDDTSPDNKALPPEFAHLNACRLADGHLTDEFVGRIKELYRRASAHR
jgi:TIR domain/SIR2-like domain